MIQTNEELIAEIDAHSEKSIALFKEGQSIHEAYKSAPEQYNLSEEIEEFSGKLNEGVAEQAKANALRKKLIGR